MNHDIYHPRYDHIRQPDWKPVPFIIGIKKFPRLQSPAPRKAKPMHKAALPRLDSKAHARRKKLFAETRNHCVYCNTIPPESIWTFDHIIPACSGGSDSLANFVPACSPCNSDRGTKLPASLYAHEAWRDYVIAKEEELAHKLSVH